MDAKRGATKHAWDPDDAPELTDAMLERAEFRIGAKLVRRGRPKLATPKQLVSLRLDADVVEHFRGTGRGWQTRINAALRRAMEPVRRRKKAR